MRINLLPEEYRAKPLIKLGNLLILFGCGFLVILALGFVGFEYFNCQDLNSKIVSLEQRISFYQIKLQEVQQLESNSQEILKKKKEIEQITGFYQPQLDIIKNLATALPDNLWLNEVGSDKTGKVTVNGQSLHVALVGSFLTELNAEELFKSSRLKDIKKVEDDNLSSYDFSLLLETGRGSLEYAEKQ